MNALDSPLEALALNYLSFGFLTAVNNIWAWVAVITAAVSVWKIRASSPRDNETSLLTCSSSPPPSLPSSSSSVGFERVAVAELAEAETSTPSSSVVSVFQKEGRTSGKFTVYYREEEEEDCGNDDGNDVVDALGGDGGGRKREDWLGNSWEVMMKMRMGDMGWYRYQDLTVLDGNVVRLWDGCR